ncbi:uncharacterized protein G2W53_022462 [Senna tora]|uniref:Uncharacterized protein n=1 Tax=Senna tora TaxID=362788 RepID=A0A834TLA1_9FABA|nr:uncharacterized protein G2W53_022462 [Senna tora]
MAPSPGQLSLSSPSPPTSPPPWGSLSSSHHPATCLFPCDEDARAIFSQMPIVASIGRRFCLVFTTITATHGSMKNSTGFISRKVFVRRGSSPLQRLSMTPPTSTTTSDSSRAANARKSESSASGTVANNFATGAPLLSTPSSTIIFSLKHYQSVLCQPICIMMAMAPPKIENQVCFPPLLSMVSFKASSAFVSDLELDSPPIASFLVLGSAFNLHHPFFNNSPPLTTGIIWPLVTCFAEKTPLR